MRDADEIFEQTVEDRNLYPGDQRRVVRLRWVSGKTTVLPYIYTRGSQWWKREPIRRGQIVEYAEVPWVILDPKYEWADGALAARYTGFWSYLLVPWYGVRRGLRPLGRLLWRLAWAVYLMDYQQGDWETWRCFRPYRWLQGKLGAARRQGRES